MDVLIDGYIYDSVARFLHDSHQEMKSIWIPSKKIIINNNGTIYHSDTPLCVKDVYIAEDKYLKYTNQSTVKGGKTIIFNYDEIVRVKQDAMEKSLKSIKISVKTVEDLEQLLLKKEKIEKSLGDIDNNISITTRQLF